jgi:hypothetical protein
MSKIVAKYSFLMSYRQSLEDLARLEALALNLESVSSLKLMSSAAVFQQSTGFSEFGST